MAKSGKSVLLAGFGGKTGADYSRLLARHFERVFLYDRKEDLPLPDGDFLRAGEKDISSDEFLSGLDAVTLSPGVPLSQPVFHRARELGVKIFSELEFTAPLLSSFAQIAVTGTDGKSTTVALIAHLLGDGIPCGNFGLPFSRIVLEPDAFAGGTLVMELSSYQLELCSGFSPRVAVYLNLAPDHLNRYESLQAYGDAKWNMIAGMKKNSAVIVQHALLPQNPENIWGSRHRLLTDLSDKAAGKNALQFIAVNTDSLHSPDFRVEKDGILNRDGSLVVKTTDLAIRGRHNLANILFALEAVKAARGTMISGSELATRLKTFRGLPHRFEILPSADGNTYINDSKATTTQACIQAINNAQDPLFLFLGGQGKGEDYSVLLPALAGRNAALFLYGAEKDKMKAQLSSGALIAAVCGTLEESLIAAEKKQAAENMKGVTFLLAPAATSWDQFSSFEERGDHFRRLVAEKQS